MQATVSSPMAMQMQATQLITRAVDYRSELVSGLQNTTKVCTCTVAKEIQATVSSPMQMQATQLITRADYRSELVIGLQSCIKLVRCTEVVQQETDYTASGAMTLARRDILICR